jgi:hypothetical protein
MHHSRVRRIRSEFFRRTTHVAIETNTSRNGAKHGANEQRIEIEQDVSRFPRLPGQIPAQLQSFEDKGECLKSVSVK